MNVSNLLSHDAPPPVQRIATPEATQHHQPRAHPYTTRQSVSTSNQIHPEPHNGCSYAEAGYNGNNHHSTAPYEPPASTMAVPKNVAFELLFDGPNTRARLPMRVQIFPHDTTDSILTTVKNFYGLYDGAAAGVSFEDERGNTLIARYENLRNGMIVYVRVLPDYSQPAFPHGRVGWNSASPISPAKAPHLDAAFQMPLTQLSQHSSLEDHVSRPNSRVARKRSASPRANRSVSAPKNRSRPGLKSRDTSLPRNTEEHNSDAMNCYSDSDGGAGSVTSSFKARSEQLASAEISVDNIVEGGRRKRAKFESSVRILLPSPYCYYSLMTSFPGTTPLCTSSGASGKFHIIHIASEALQRPGESFSFYQTSTTFIHLFSTSTISTKLWTWRVSAWDYHNKQHSTVSATVCSTWSSPT